MQSMQCAKRVTNNLLTTQIYRNRRRHLHFAAQNELTVVLSTDCGVSNSAPKSADQQGYRQDGK
jgi:hypothetical protein